VNRSDLLILLFFSLENGWAETYVDPETLKMLKFMGPVITKEI